MLLRNKALFDRLLSEYVLTYFSIVILAYLLYYICYAMATPNEIQGLQGTDDAMSIAKESSIITFITDYH